MTDERSLPLSPPIGDIDMVFLLIDGWREWLDLGVDERNMLSLSIGVIELALLHLQLPATVFLHSFLNFLSKNVYMKMLMTEFSATKKFRTFVRLRYH